MLGNDSRTTVDATLNSTSGRSDDVIVFDSDRLFDGCCCTIFVNINQIYYVNINQIVSMQVL
jgi:hypothetical protein